MKRRDRARDRIQVYLAAHPLRALVETWLLGLVILFLLSQLVGQVPVAVLSNGLLMTCAACGLWVVVRTRVPACPGAAQILWELGVAFALSGVKAAGLRLSADLLGWSEVWKQTAVSNTNCVAKSRV
jgi:hypothetical protein